MCCKTLITNHFAGDIIIQRHVKGSGGDFAKYWSDYKNGFGSEGGNYYWVGLDTIHGITSSGSYSLEINLKSGGQTKTVTYSSFSVENESNDYRLSVSGFNAGSSGLRDSLNYHNGRDFSTRDRDNDGYSSGSCSVSSGGNGGWWFGYCRYSNLNYGDSRGPEWYYNRYDESTMIIRR